MTVRIVVGNNVDRKAVAVDDSATLKSVLEAQGIDYSTGATNLDGATLGAGDLNKTFADFGITESAYLLHTPTKLDNA